MSQDSKITDLDRMLAVCLVCFRETASRLKRTNPEWESSAFFGTFLPQIENITTATIVMLYRTEVENKSGEYKNKIENFAKEIHELLNKDNG